MKRFLAVTTALSLFAVVGMFTSCKKSEAPQQAQRAGGIAPTEERVEKNPDRNAYFCGEHIHTSWSVDAWLFGNRVTGPDDALKYAQGQTIKHPLGYDIKIETPMDFMGVTDHSEYVGVTKEANTTRLSYQQAAGSATIDPSRPKQPGRSAEGSSCTLSVWKTCPRSRPS